MHLAVNLGGIPHLAKNERDMGHPALVREREGSDLALKLQSPFRTLKHGCADRMRGKSNRQTRRMLAMSSFHGTHGNLDRRKFFQGAGGCRPPVCSHRPGDPPRKAAQAVTPESISHASVSPPMSESEKMVRIASNSYPIRDMFRTRSAVW